MFVEDRNASAYLTRLEMNGEQICATENSSLLICNSFGMIGDCRHVPCSAGKLK